ncbi:MAG: hypothetical protein M1822_008176 [Bathelium mastoideum]|nr:MAG: hypothetical protein M1822_008176 [Bathelium mastoideum]
MRSFIPFALSISAALAHPNHALRHLHNKRTTAMANILDKSAILTGTNADSGPIRLGGSGDYVVDFVNDSDEDTIVLLVWNMASGGSEYSGNAITSCGWCKGVAPAISAPLHKNSSSGAANVVSVAFDSGISGGWGAAYTDTPSTLDVQGSGGQLPNTIQEFTWGEQGVVDTSLEVYSKGHSVHAKGPVCSTSNTECNFACDDASALSCEFGYTLHNCAGTGQIGDNTQSGGCSAGPVGSKWKVSFKN